MSDRDWKAWKAERQRQLEAMWDSGHRLGVEGGLLYDTGEPKSELWKVKRQAKEAAMEDITPKDGE